MNITYCELSLRGRGCLGSLQTFFYQHALFKNLFLFTLLSYYFWKLPWVLLFYTFMRRLSWFPLSIYFCHPYFVSRLYTCDWNPLSSFHKTEILIKFVIFFFIKKSIWLFKKISLEVSKWGFLFEIIFPKLFIFSWI